MSKGSGSTRGSNSSSAHGGNKSAYVSPILSNGMSASELTDEQIGYRTHMSNQRRFSADQEALRIEAKHRVNMELKQRIKSFDKDFKAYKDAESAFISEFKKEVVGLSLNPFDSKPQFLGSARKDKDRQKAFKEAQEHLDKIRNKVLGTPVLLPHVDEKIFYQWHNIIKSHKPKV